MMSGRRVMQKDCRSSNNRLYSVQQTCMSCRGSVVVQDGDGEAGSANGLPENSGCHVCTHIILPHFPREHKDAKNRGERCI